MIINRGASSSSGSSYQLDFAAFATCEGRCPCGPSRPRFIKTPTATLLRKRRFTSSPIKGKVRMLRYNSYKPVAYQSTFDDHRTSNQRVHKGVTQVVLTTHRVPS